MPVSLHACVVEGSMTHSWIDCSLGSCLYPEVPTACGLMVTYISGVLCGMEIFMFADSAVSCRSLECLLSED